MTATPALSQAQLATILGGVADGIIVTSVDNRTLYVNASAARIAGFPFTEPFVSAPFRAVDERYILSDESGQPLPRTAWPTARLLRGEESDEVALQVRDRTTGAQRWWAVHSTPIRDAQGTLQAVIAMFRDITETKDLERAREELLSSASHDLKNPLTSIRGYAQLAQRRLARLTDVDTGPIAAQLTNINAATSRMLALIDELIDVTRGELGGTVELNREPTDLVALVRDIVVARRGLTAHRFTLDIQIPELFAPIDAVRFERVIANLLSNAEKYSPNHQEITVRIAREEGDGGHEAVIAIADGGVGIPQADIPHIFDRFQRARNVVGQIQGSGIGLASALQIVEEHGGTIAVESEEGVGSTFTVRLPLE